MASREYAEAEKRQDGIEKPKGIYCIKCGYFYRDWDEFLQHHRVKHPWTVPDALESASV